MNAGVERGPYQMSPAALPWLMFAAGMLAISLGFILAMREGYIDACFPYWDGCASISKVGRQGDAARLYRFALLPYATFLLVYWLLNLGWTRQLGLRRGAWAMTACGLVSALALMVHLSVLGATGELYPVMRRIGVTCYFLGAMAGHALLAYMLAPLCRERLALRRPWSALRALLIALLAMGALSVPAYWVVQEDGPLENILEWNGTLLMQLHLICVALLWSRTGLRLRWHAAVPAEGAQADDAKRAPGGVGGGDA